MRLLLIPIIFFGTFLPVSAQRKYALVIGNSDYPAPGNLKNPVHDAELITKSLIQCNFEVLYFKNLSKREMRKAVDSFSRKISRPGCTALFYYSGHGIQDKGLNYMIPTDASIKKSEDIEYECIRVDAVLKKMEDSRSKVNIIFLDACRNDPFSRSWGRGGGINDRGLAIISNPHNSFIMYSTSPGEVAADGLLDNSPFSKSLAKYITDPGLTIETIYKKVKSEITKIYAKQIPWTASTLGEEFYFNTPVTGTVPGSVMAAEKNVVPQLQIFVTAKTRITINGDDKGVINPAEGAFNSDIGTGKFIIRSESVLNPDIVHQDTLEITQTQIDDYDRPFVLIVEMQSAINNHSTTNELKTLQERSLAGGTGPNEAITSILNDIKYSMVPVEGGEFDMGTSGGNNDESPVHKIKLSDYYLCKYEVTQQQWDKIMGASSGKITDCANCPVVNINWNDAILFINKINELSGDKYRLPTEAEWEYAARGGYLKISQKFSGSGKLDKYGWYYENAGKKNHPVGKKGSNELGIYDMSGNVSEWCSDWYDIAYYKSGETNNPKGPQTGKKKVIRGGSFDDYDAACRVFSRGQAGADEKKNTIGLRLAKTNTEKN